MSPFHGQNHRNKELVNLDICVALSYVASTVLRLLYERRTLKF
jgi:hypothetical protein